jgi:transposase-like protein
VAQAANGSRCPYGTQRGSLNRSGKRGRSRLPDTKEATDKKRFKDYPIGYFHIDIAEVRTEEGKLYLFVAIDHTSRFVFVHLHETATRQIAGHFLPELMTVVPYPIHPLLTDNGTHFTTPVNRHSAAKELKEALASGHSFRTGL